jgi:hypothetical protein
MRVARVGRRERPDNLWFPIAAAMFWLVAAVIEGFSACGEAMSPGLTVPGELIGQAGQERIVELGSRVDRQHDRPQDAIY